ncbi:hypothetical protein K1719_043915 [Acacia pycnantha]|nr:hypothetical protein K1719_043915 [Acacia pycnantha]
MFRVGSKLMLDIFHGSGAQEDLTADGVQIKKPIEVSAPKYVEYLKNWIECQLDDESIFPQKIGAPFPPNFIDVVKTIFKRLFRVYAHAYHSHFQKIVSLKEEAHLNACFKHFVLFTCGLVGLELNIIDLLTQYYRHPHLKSSF